ncbi:MAG: hypothetical protein AAF511_12720 [Pseudomonadota bacterium]
MSEVTESEKKAGGGFAKFLLFLMILAIALGTYTLYSYGADGHITINGRSVDDLALWEVAGAVAIGFVGLVIGLIGGLIGVVVALAAASIAVALGLLGIFAGIFLTAGFLLGPILLIILIVMVIRKRTNPDVI